MHLIKCINIKNEEKFVWMLGKKKPSANKIGGRRLF
jgi:hypothetical protein